MRYTYKNHNSYLCTRCVYIYLNVWRVTFIHSRAFGLPIARSSGIRICQRLRWIEDFILNEKINWPQNTLKTIFEMIGKVFQITSIIIIMCFVDSTQVVYFWHFLLICNRCRLHPLVHLLWTNRCKEKNIFKTNYILFQSRLILFVSVE